MGLFKRPDSVNYWFRFKYRNRLIQESTRTSNRRAAEQIFAARRVQLAKGDVGIAERPSAPTLEDFLAERFIPHVRIQCASKPHTVAFYECRANRLLNSRLATKTLDTISREDVEQYKSTAFGKVATVNRDLATLRRALNYAVELGVIQYFTRIKLLPGEAIRDYVLSQEDEVRYLDVVSDTLHTLALIMIDCGLRESEVFKLERSHITNGRILVYSGKGVGSRRSIEMTPRVRAALNATNSDSFYFFPAPTKSGHIEHSSVRKRHVKALRDSGVSKFVLHSLRHTCITRWAEAGMDAPTLQYLAGHSSIVITMRYIHLASTSVQSRLREVRGRM